MKRKSSDYDVTIADGNFRRVAFALPRDNSRARLCVSTGAPARSNGSLFSVAAAILGAASVTGAPISIRSTAVQSSIRWSYSGRQVNHYSLARE